MIEIKYSKRNSPYVWASELHKELGVSIPLERWFPLMAAYGFEENKDFSYHHRYEDDEKSLIKYEWAVHLEMAKHIAMLQRSEQGKNLRDSLLFAEKQKSEGELLSRDQISALIEIINILGLFSVQIFLEKEHYEQFILSNKSNAWWGYRAKLFGFTTEDLKTIVTTLGFRYVNQRQALFHIEKYRLVKMATMDLFLAMGKSEYYAKNIAKTAETLARDFKISIYDDRSLAIDFTNDSQKKTIEKVRSKIYKTDFLKTF